MHCTLEHQKESPLSLGNNGPLSVPPVHLNTSKKSEKRLKWHLGIRAKSQPQDILRELCNVLIELDYEWKIITTFNLRCRPKQNHFGKIRIGLQLYEADLRNYIVDFKCIMPPTAELVEWRPEAKRLLQPLILDFFDRCYAIIKALPQ